MIDYVDKWYNQLHKLQHINDAPARKRNLQDALRNSVELSQLGSTPLILNLMALVHMSDGELARSRAILYHRTISHLLSDKPHWRRAYGSLTISQSDLQPLAAHIAYRIHLKELENPARRHGLSFQEIEDIVAAKSEVPKVNNAAAYKRSRERITGIVQRLVDSNGLLVVVSHGQFGFSHRSLQEFLTGLHILDLADVGLIRSFAARAHWREPLILMAGYGGREGSATFFIATVIDALVNDAMADTVNGVHLAILTGEMLAEIGAPTLRARSQGWVLDGRPDQPGPSTWDHVAALIGDASRQAELGERIKLLRVLGRLGDPRIVRHDGSLVPFLDRTVFLPPTSLDVGDDDPARPKPKSDLVETVPKRRVTFGGMHVPRYMVTNAEYERFIDDEGYEDRSLWRDEGWRWRSEDATFREELEAKTKEWIERDFGPELALGRYRLDDILSDARDMSRARIEPFYWRNERYNQPTQPVVGVNMWEAMAYCEWLLRQARRDGLLSDEAEIRLPTEWEWERAARGSRRNTTFPWGDEPLTAKRAHTRAANLALGYAAPVGAFPDGKTDHNLFDFAGNAWEWTASRAVPPDPEHDPVRNNIGGIVDVVVRGGSWFSDEPQSVRCGYRGIDLPQNVYFDVGFRPFVFNYQQEERSNGPGTETVRRRRSSSRYQP
jgi:formylglycine-generating enzyme required for sulfatase activity